MSAASSRPLDEFVELKDAEGIMGLLGQLHAVQCDRRRLTALTDVSSSLLIQESMLPQAVANLNIAKEIEVLLEAVAAQSCNVRHLAHVLALAEEEHTRLLRRNDELLSIAKGKEDLHTRYLKQYQFAGSIDAEAHEALMKLEARRQKLAGHATTLRTQVTVAKGVVSCANEEAHIAAEGEGRGSSWKKVLAPTTTRLNNEPRRSALMAVSNNPSRFGRSALPPITGLQSKNYDETPRKGRDKKPQFVLPSWGSTHSIASPSPSSHDVDGDGVRGGSTSGGSLLRQAVQILRRETCNTMTPPQQHPSEAMRRQGQPSSSDSVEKGRRLRETQQSDEVHHSAIADKGGAGGGRRGGSRSESRDRILFELRMQCHALLKQFEAVASEAFDFGIIYRHSMNDGSRHDGTLLAAEGSTDRGPPTSRQYGAGPANAAAAAVNGSDAAANRLRTLLGGPSDGRGDLWLLDGTGCTKPACVQARKQLHSLEGARHL